MNGDDAQGQWGKVGGDMCRGGARGGKGQDCVQVIVLCWGVRLNKLEAVKGEFFHCDSVYRL